MSVYLIISGLHKLALVMQDGFSSGYQNEFKSSAGNMQTHPLMKQWKGGSVSDFEIPITLAAGVEQGQPKIETAAQLVRVVELLYDMCLPAAKKSTIDTVLVAIQGGSRNWFNQRALLKSIDAKWQPPYEISTGMPMIVDLTLSFEPHFAGATFMTGKAPTRNWRFRKQSTSGNKGVRRLMTGRQFRAEMGLPQLGDTEGTPIGSFARPDDPR